MRFVSLCGPLISLLMILLVFKILNVLKKSKKYFWGYQMYGDLWANQIKQTTHLTKRPGSN